MTDRLMVSVARIVSPRLFGLALLLAVGLIAFAGASLVAAQRGGSGGPPAPAAFQGCVNTHTGVLRIIADGQSCQDHETAIALGSSGGDAALLERIEELEARVTELEANQAVIPACLTTEAVNGQERDDIVFEGCNVHVQSGAGATYADVNGLGNLIVGYNEDLLDFDTRTGSHNLVIGPYHSYTSFGGLVAGIDNEVNGIYSSVSGGEGNSADGDLSSISGGGNNTASGVYSSVSGGVGNNITSDGNYGSISGGQENTVSGGASSVSAGYDNTASGQFSSVSGGTSNLAGNSYSSVSGGFNNEASGASSSISGGHNNTASGESSSASGGRFNIANGDGGSVGGGGYNTARGPYSSISGGTGNLVDTDSQYGSISGGLANTVTGNYGSVSGGHDNTASGAGSAVGGGTALDADETYEFLP